MLYIVNGISSYEHGAGRLFAQISTYFKEENIIISPNKENKAKEGLRTSSFLRKNVHLLKLLRTIYYKFNTLVFKNKLKKIKNSKVFVYHPQTIGINNVRMLIKNNDKVFFYVLDNYFFCIKSYNLLLNGKKPCVKCLGNFDGQPIKKEKCKSFPIQTSIEDYLAFKNVLKNNLEKITFLTQNSNQEDLLKLNFEDNDIKIIRLGMITDEFESYSKIQVLKEKIDFVFHGTLFDAKGISIVFNLAHKMPKNSFLIPYSEEEVRGNFPNCDFSKNIIFEKCSWSTGLKERLLEAKVVLCPSLWSAPIEGGVLKSLYFNGCAVVFNADYSFGKQLPNDIVIKLSDTSDNAVSLLESFLYNDEKRITMKKNTMRWTRGFIDKNRDLFEENIKNVL